MDSTEDSTVSFAFETTYITQNSSERLAISGSNDALGNWDYKNAVIAKEIPMGSGRWMAAVELPKNDEFEWKWLVIAKDRSRVIRWEERPNRSLVTETCPTHVRAAWNFGQEKEIPLKHKFKQRGATNSCSENEEEWSYLPSEELFRRLCKDEDEENQNENDETLQPSSKNENEGKSTLGGILTYFRSKKEHDYNYHPLEHDDFKYGRLNSDFADDAHEEQKQTCKITNIENKHETFDDANNTEIAPRPKKSINNTLTVSRETSLIQRITNFCSIL